MGKIEILGVQIDLIDIAGLHEFIRRAIVSGDHKIISNVNVHAINLCFQYPWLRDFFNGSGAVFCDGAGVQLGAKILGTQIPDRITYADWMWDLSWYAASQHFSFYFLGARDGVAEKAASQLWKKFPDLEIGGCHHGYFDKTPGSSESQSVIDKINVSKANILVVGFGMPLQELWLRDNWPSLHVNVALTGGAVFDYVSGDLQRGHRILTGHGLEWLARLLIEPQRLWRRYLVGNPIFLWRILRQRLGIDSYTAS
jgi:N-acetylglucosaminyldiphosphoundecaprenol N-acetyl-beta-D-mannosaminyltransferase